MAKIIIAGDAVVITSSMKFEDLLTIKKYQPDALTLFGGEEGKDPIFKVDVTTGAGSINQFGASFAKATRDDEKLATLTMSIIDATDDVKEWVADKVGAALMNLCAIEETLPDVLQGIEARKAEIMSNIEIAQ